jgi:hypothetical protein
MMNAAAQARAIGAVVLGVPAVPLLRGIGAVHNDRQDDDDGDDEESELGKFIMSHNLSKRTKMQMMPKSFILKTIIG